MSDPQLIGPVPLSTPADSKSRACSVPYDLLKDASKRLEIMSLVATSLWVLGTIAGRFAGVALGIPLWRWQFTDWITFAAVAASMGLFFYIRSSDRDPQFILDLGLVYMVFTSGAIGLMVHYLQHPAVYPAPPMVSWIGAVILM